MSVSTPIVNAPNLYVDDLQLAWASNTTLTVASGAARNSTNVNDIILDAGVTIDSAVSGYINGIDQGALAASTMYAVYAVGDSTQNNTAGAVISTSFTAPSIPVGYDMYRRIGAVLTDGSVHFLLFWQFGDNQVKDMYYDVGISELAGGASQTYAAVDLATSVPPIATNVIFLVTFTPDGAGELAHFLPYGSSATNGIVQFGTGVAAAQVGMATVPARLNSGVPTIQYKVAAGDTLSLSTAGYTDYL